MLTTPEPIIVTALFPEMLAELLSLLGGLSDTEWAADSVDPGWTVKDIATHLLGGDVGILSRKRDGYTPPGQPINSWDDLVALINGLNASWQQAGQRISPVLLTELLAFTGPKVCDYFASLDLYAMGEAVSWAGPEPAPVWLDVAREYTERWHHQQQIRDAVGKPGLMQSRYLHPALDAFVRALPYTFRDASASAGTLVTLSITGEGGGDWSLRRESEGWQLYVGSSDAPTSTVTLDADSAWRLFTKGMSAAQAQTQAVIAGDQQLGQQVLTMVSVIA